MTHCIRCLLPDTFPGIRFEDSGECNYCRNAGDPESRPGKQEEYRERFERLLQAPRTRSDYDVLLGYSGGKDSTYTLSLLKREYHLRVLAVTFDNGFISDNALANIRRVVETLDVDHYFFKPRFGLMKRVFRGCLSRGVYPLKMLERATAICTSCMALVKFSSLRLALDKGIPFIAYGWSPGQVPLTSALMKNNPDMLRLMQEAVRKPLMQIAGEEILPYFLDDRYFSGAYAFPYNVSPLAFWPYREEAILRAIEPLGWKKPSETDANSTNCLLNSFSNGWHREEYGFHPYAMEIAGLIRAGALTLEEGREKLSRPENPEVVEAVRRKLGLDAAGSGRSEA